MSNSEHIYVNSNMSNSGHIYVKLALEQNESM